MYTFVSSVTNLSFIFQLTERPEDVLTTSPVRSAPRIAAFTGEEAVQYFVLVEQAILCQVPTFQFALFISFSSYYVFHLEYPRQIKNMLFFIQDYVLGYPDSYKRPGTYLAIASDIKKLMDS